MDAKKDIENLADIRILVDHFYDKVKADALLGPIFYAVIQNRWPEHLDKMYRFWQTVLLEEHTYSGSPFLPHAKMPVQKEHFDRWIQLFTETVDHFFAGEKAERAKWQGQRMAEMFQIKIQYYRNSNAIPLV